MQQQQTINLENINAADVLRRNVKHEIAVEIDATELGALARLRAAEERKLKQMEQKFADLKTEWREKIETQESLIAKYSTDIDREKQDRVIECTEVVQGNVVLIVRQDTNEVYTTRALAMHETQRNIPGTSGSNGVLAEAAAAQKASNSETNDEGDVEPNDGSDEDKPKRGRKK